MQNDEVHVNATSKDYDIRLFARLLRPSALSGLLCVLIAFLTVTGVVLASNYEVKGFRQELLGFQQRQEEEKLAKEQAELEQMMYDPFGNVSLSADYGQINDSFANNNLIRNIPVMIFWMFVGALVYFLVTGIFGAFQEARNIGDELNYMHVRRQELLRVVYIKTGIRLATLVIWLLYVTLFMRIILPYALAAAHIAANNVLSFSALPYLALAFFSLVVSLHLHVMLLRLTLLRPRVFSADSSF